MKFNSEKENGGWNEELEPPGSADKAALTLSPTPTPRAALRAAPSAVYSQEIRTSVFWAENLCLKLEFTICEQCLQQARWQTF